MMFRYTRTILVMLLVCMGILAACGASSDPLARTLSPTAIASYVGAHYGDPHAKVISATSDVSDSPPHDPIYHMSISGHFHKNGLQASTLGFSAMADKMYPWDIGAFDQAGNEVWLEMEIAPQPKT